MGKHVEKLGSLEDFTAPWETGAGEVEIDKDKLKRYIFNLSKDKAQAQDARDEASEKVTEIQQQLEAEQAKVAEGDTSGEIKTLQDKLAKAESERDDAKGTLLRLEVGTEKGLTPKQAARLQGKTKEELEADADEILETFGVSRTTTEGDEEEEEEEPDEVSTTPRSTVKLVNPADKAGDKGEPDYAAVVAGFDRPRI